MSTIRGILAVLVLSVSGFASAEIITADPSLSAAGTDVTHAYEGASFYSSGISSAGVISYDAVYAADCVGCRPAVDGQRLFAQQTPGSDSFRTRFDYEVSFARRLKNETTEGSWGNILLVDFEEETNFLQVVGSRGNCCTNFKLDIWDDLGNWLGSCADGGVSGANGSSGGCRWENLSGSAYELPLWQLSFASDIANIGFVTIGGGDGPGYVKSVAYSVPEPASVALLALGVAGLLMARRKSSV